MNNGKYLAQGAENRLKVAQSSSLVENCKKAIFSQCIYTLKLHIFYFYVYKVLLRVSGTYLWGPMSLRCMQRVAYNTHQPHFLPLPVLTNSSEILKNTLNVYRTIISLLLSTYSILELDPSMVKCRSILQRRDHGHCRDVPISRQHGGPDISFWEGPRKNWQ